MTERRSWLPGATIGVLSACLFVVGGALEVAAAKERPTAEMREVFEAMAQLLPIALSDERWQDPANRAQIQRWLDELASRSAALEGHAMRRDAGFEYLSRSLASDIEEVRERFRIGRVEEARYFMIGSTGNCVACHSRLPSEKAFPMAEGLIERIDMESLSTHERIQILLATRQFGAALEAWEALFADPSMQPGQLDASGYLLDYMTVGLRVQNDPERLARTLAKLEERPDAPAYLKRHLRDWQRSLESAKPLLAKDGTLEKARSLVFEPASSANPLSRDRTVQDLIASSVLLRLLDGDLDPTSRAEAYYLLGVVESRTIDSYWVPQAEVHLEAAIRMAPEAPFAEDAYAVLEEYIVVGWGGRSLGELPVDEWAKLTDLRKLLGLEEAAPASPPDPGPQAAD